MRCRTDFVEGQAVDYLPGPLPDPKLRKAQPAYDVAALILPVASPRRARRKAAASV